MSDLVERLRHADAHSQQRILGSRIFDEAATEIEALRRENQELRHQFDTADKLRVFWNDKAAEQAVKNQELRETNRKMHRRAQLAERTHQMTIDVLTGWYDFLREYARNAPRKDRFLFRRAIDDMKSRAERFDRDLTMSDTLDRPRREAE